MYQRSASAPRSAQHRPRVDHVAARLRHLQAVLVDDVREAHDVAVRRAVEHERVHREQRVEPAARLVDRLADEVGGEARVERRRRSRTGSGTARSASTRSRTTRRAPARCAYAVPRSHARARDRDVVDVRAVQVHAGEVAVRELRRARRPSRRTCRGRSRRSATPGSACPSSGRARAPSRRCSRASRRSGRA